MRFAAAVLLSILLSIAAFVQPAGAQDAPATNQAATEAATQAATQAAAGVASAWLATTDAGKYEDSWNEGAKAFRTAVTGQQWNEAMRAVRAPLGAVKSRKLIAAQYTRQIPGAPAGEYVVVQYLTEFATRSATETVTPMREADGSWKVSGYYIQ